MSDYRELRSASAFSFLRGASNPEDLVAEAARLDYPSLALGDRDGVYGAPRFFRAARIAGLRPLVGSELSLEDGSSLYVLVESREGYRNLTKLLTEAKLRAPKGEARVGMSDLEPHSEGLLCFLGGKEGPLAEAANRHDGEAGLATVRRFTSTFPGRVWIDLQRHLSPKGEARNRFFTDLAESGRVPLVVTNDVRYATPRRCSLFDVLTCIREKITLDSGGRRLAANAERFLKSPRAMAELFRDVPEAVLETRAISERCEFTLDDLGYRFPDAPRSPGDTPVERLRSLTFAGARRRYGTITSRVRRQLEHELGIIARLDLAGYFLVVWDVVEFCRREKILVQGRGSAANSAVCYALGITAVDAVGMDLLFERFLSEERGEWPDIDLDLPSGDQRERVIQYVYRRYGERGAGMTANVITYRVRSAVREIGKALGLPESAIERLSKCLRSHGYRDQHDRLEPQIRRIGLDPDSRTVRNLLRLADEIEGLPRHLGQHSGGMVIAGGRLDEVVPLEPARMPGRVVVQWDKDDCADLGILKIDLLGLGMMAVLENAIPLVRDFEGIDLDLAHLPPDDPDVYAALQRADTIGVFQVESRAQMATLPRMKPACFYDLVVEVAIIRPGPITGQMVHPYLNRRAGREAIRYPHPSLEPILRRTLGVPLFQEQLLRMAVAVAGFTPGEAEELRRAMGFKRSVERMREIEERLREGMRKNEIHGESAEEMIRAITSFALYGFPESHAASFALLAYASAYLKVHHPAAFLCAMLNRWPLGFYHPATLVNDAQRHGVLVLPIDVTCSSRQCILEKSDHEAKTVAVRLGLDYVAGLRGEVADRIEAERASRAFSSLAELSSRTGIRRTELDSLAHAGALSSFGLTRREAQWQLAGIESGPLFEAVDPPEQPTPLPEMSHLESTLADYESTGMTLGSHLMKHLRADLDRRGVLSSRRIRKVRNGQRARIAGHVIVRQRPGTAKGFLFLTLEDEWGTSNAVVTPNVFERHRVLLQTAPLLMVEGPVQNVDGVLHVRGERFEAIAVTSEMPASHDFR